MYPILKYQPYIVILVAGAYVVVQVACKAFCKETKVAEENYTGKSYSAVPYCNAPTELNIHLAYVGTSGTLAQSAVSFTPQISGDAETLTFQFV